MWYKILYDYEKIEKVFKDISILSELFPLDFKSDGNVIECRFFSTKTELFPKKWIDKGFNATYITISFFIETAIFSYEPNGKGKFFEASKVDDRFIAKFSFPNLKTELTCSHIIIAKIDKGVVNEMETDKLLAAALLSKEAS